MPRRDRNYGAELSPRDGVIKNVDGRGHHRFYDAVVAGMAEVADQIGARMLAARTRDYAAEYRARVARAERRGQTRTEARGHGRGVRGAQAALRTEKGLLAASEQRLGFRADELEALRRLRGGEAASPADAERQLGLPRGSLRRDLPTAFDGRGRVKPGDREAMLMRIAGSDGDVSEVVRGNRQRRIVGQHRAAVLGVLAGDLPASALDRFRGQRVSGVELETNLDRLRALFDLGRLDGGPYPEAPPR